MDLDWLLVEKPGEGGERSPNGGQRSPNGVLRAAADDADRRHRDDDEMSDADSSTATSFNAAVASTSGRIGGAGGFDANRRSGRRSPRLRAAAILRTAATPTTAMPVSRPRPPPAPSPSQQRKGKGDRAISFTSASKRALASLIASLRESVSPEELALFKSALAVVVAALVVATVFFSFRSSGAEGTAAATPAPARLSLLSSPEEQLGSTLASLPSLPPV